MDVEDVERRLHRVRNILHAQALVSLLKRDGLDGCDIKHIHEALGMLQDYKTLKAQIVAVDAICEISPPELHSENRARLMKLLADVEEQVNGTLKTLEGQSRLLRDSKNFRMLEVMEDINEATEIFKRRIRRKVNREKQDKADKTEDASVA